jgi:hypothetical protein
MGILATKYMGVDFSADMYAKDYAQLSPILQKIDFLPKGSDELFVGRAGYLAGHLIVKKYLNIEVSSYSLAISLNFYKTKIK